MNFKTALAQIVNRHHSFTLLMAPMGWGKTRLIWQLHEDFKNIVIISPLRSIIEDLKEREFVVDNIFHKGIYLTTVESLSKEQLDYAIKNDYLFVLDEYHLFYEWGETFRPRLMELIYRLSTDRAKLLGLSATITEELQCQIESDVKNNFCHYEIVNVGNFQKKNPHKFESRAISPIVKLRFLFNVLIAKEGRSILFVPTRNEALRWHGLFESLGLSSDYCIGGEVNKFSERQRVQESKYIFATSALSHGVNLRGIEGVFISYIPNDSTEFQMIGRGGRFGEVFNFYGTKPSKDAGLHRFYYKFCEYLLIISKDILRVIHG